MPAPPINLLARNTEKPWDLQRPVQRINCPAQIYGGNRAGGDQPIDGWGFECGCREPGRDMASMTAGEFFEDLGEALLAGLVGGVVLGLIGAGIGALAGVIGGGIAAAAGKSPDIGQLAKDGAIYGAAIGAGLGFLVGVVGWFLLKSKATSELLRTVPSWVHIENTRSVTLDKSAEVEREVQGKLTQSFQTWTDMPLLPYHQYFDWNFYLEPDPGYQYIAARGNYSDHESKMVLECEWDTGAFAGGAPDDNGALYSGLDLAWPMYDQQVWLAGRWIVDCGHGKTDPQFKKLTDNQKKFPHYINKSQLMRAELHPVKALASARTQGVSFSRNGDFYVPGVRFMFFASRRGGYFEFADLASKDYEFIVDLPRHPSQASMHGMVMPSPDYPDCFTFVATALGLHGIPPLGGLPLIHGRRTELLMRITVAPFHQPQFGKMAPNVRPRVEPIIDPNNPTALPTQVKVTIPLTQAGPDDDAYGVHVELGWLDDANHSLARMVNIYKVTFHHVTKLNADHKEFGEMGGEDWRIRYGVNGFWKQTPEKELDAGDRLSLEDANFKLHLADDDPITVCIHGTEHDGTEDIFRWSDDERHVKLDGEPVDYNEDIVQADPQRRRSITREIFSMMWQTFNTGSDALGRINDVRRASSYQVGQSKTENIAAIALYEDTHLAETFENEEGTQDYIASWTVEVSPQPLP